MSSGARCLLLGGAPALLRQFAVAFELQEAWWPIPSSIQGSSRSATP